MKLISLLFLLLLTRLSFAHDPGLSSAEVVLNEKGVDVSITFALQDTEAFAPMDNDGDAEVSNAEREAAKPEVAALIARELELKLNEQNAKPLKLGDVVFDAQNNAHISFHYEPAATSLKIQLLFLNKLPDGHKQVVTIKDATGKNLSEKMLTQQDNVIELNLAAGESSSMFKDFFVLGVEHILTGYDHLLFLFALLIVTHRFWSAFGIITFFTIAHSITLAIAGMNLVTIPSTIVEPLIAASIVYVGIENLIVKEPKGRKYLTFAFGLIHGFGFAAVLQEMNITSIETGILVPLFSFNLGVETGQLIVTSIALPIIWWLHTKPLIEKYFVPVCSTIVCLAGSYWLIERTIL
ncbi:MAG: HupE/UreJ family protein [Methylococcales bacterium]|nr:HupE/UreJ family protein [Methylococcales bacterium]